MEATGQARGDRRRHHHKVKRRQLDLGWRRAGLTSHQAKQVWRGKTGKMSGPSLRLNCRAFPQPVGESHQVHRRRIDRLLQVRSSQPDIAATPQIKTTRAL